MNTIVTLKKGEGRTIKSGGAWVYDNEIDTITGRFTNGDMVRVHDFDGYDMGVGFINQNSHIRVRMLSRKPGAVVDSDFLYERVRAAWNYRKAVMPMEDLNCARLIFGEADWLPGLVVDKYADVLVVESLALGMDRLKEEILSDLTSLMEADGYPVRGIYERSDAMVRKKEGMEPFKGFLYAGESEHEKPHEKAESHFFNYSEFDTNIEITENGVHYLVDVVNGQKTGFFLDQKYNRLAMQKICRGLLSAKGPGEEIRVLDCFTHMGTFALNCGLALSEEKDKLMGSLEGSKGAIAGSKNVHASVLGLDISEYAISQAQANAVGNGLSDIVDFRCANVLDELPKLYEAGERYDVVILDPPAFTKSREATKNAIKGYREINMKGLKLVRDGGFLATCSCSHFMTQELFVKTISQAAASVHKRLRQVELRTQACDHPILWSADESYYLKFLIFQVCEEK